MTERQKSFWEGVWDFFLCSICFVGLGIAGYAYFDQNETAVSEPTPTTLVDRSSEATRRAEIAATDAPLDTPSPTPNEIIIIEETPTVETAVVELQPTTTPNNIGAPAFIDQTFIANQAFENLQVLLSTNYPSNDYFETGNRLGNYNIVNRTIPGPKYALGDVEIFNNGEERIEAELLEISEHAYFWVETGLNVDLAELSEAAETFETQYFEPTIEIFGSYWNPGIDQDPRISILHVSTGTSGELGRFNSIDEYPRTLYRDSNEQEIVYLSMEELDVGENLYYGTLVHELQHLIQWHQDPSEALWVNEGLSQLSEIMVGLYTADTRDYLLDPDTPLNTWNFDEPELYAHYSASYLFLVYFWEQLGDPAVQELARHPANGMAGINQILSEYQPDVTLTEFVGNWAAANFIDDIITGLDYYYDSLDFRKPTFIEVADDLPFTYDGELPQFGVHYIDLLDLRGPVQLKFAGDTVQNLISAPPASESQMWFAPPVDEMNAQLTASFDLTAVSAATLEYDIWYQLEEDYDYAYVSVSTDNGATWDILISENSNAGEFGPAYNGDSGEIDKSGWIRESISLNEYTGQIVLIRFEVLTDSDITEKGVALDNIAIPELNGYITTVEDGGAGWQVQGFVPVGHQLPQQWSVQLIQDGPEPKIVPIELDEFNQAQLDVEIGKGGAVLVIVPTTPFTREDANYWVSIEGVE